MSSIIKGLNELSNNTLASYKKKAGADATAADKKGDTKKADKRFSGIVKATKKQFANGEKKEVAEGTQRVDSLVTDALKLMRGAEVSDAVSALKTVLGDREYNGRRGHYNFYVRQLMDMYGQQGVAEAGNNYHANRTGFSRGQRDDERHDLDTPTQLWGLKINGKVWSKDGKDVTFTSKQAALNTRNAILKNRPDLEIGLVTKGGVAEEKQRLDPSCWKGYKKQGTKMKGDTRVNNCVPVKESSIMQGVKQLDEGWKEKLGAAALAGSMALGSAGASARVTPDEQGNIPDRFKPVATATDTAPSDGLARADSADRQAKTITVGGKEYGLVELSPTDIRPRGGQRIVVPQAVLGERGIGNYMGILVGDRVFVISKN